MAFVKLYREKLIHNYTYLQNLFAKDDIEWGVVTKLLCGNKLYLKELLKLGVREMHDTRISNIKTIKQLDPSVQTVYIKPPAKRSVASVIKYADVSFNTEYATIKMLSDEAVRQNKKHKIIIMIEMGDLRRCNGRSTHRFLRESFLVTKHFRYRYWHKSELFEWYYAESR